MKKAQIWISATLYTLIIIVAVLIVLTAVLPIFDKMEDRATFSNVKNNLAVIDQTILQVASEGQGSQRVQQIEVQNGFFNLKDGNLFWSFESSTRLVEPRTNFKTGNLIISSEADVNASVIGNETIIENKRLRVEFDNTATDINNIINLLDMNGTSVSGFSFELDGNDLPAISSTQLVPGDGTGLGRATFVAHFNSTHSMEFTLEGSADFLTINMDID